MQIKRFGLSQGWGKAKLIIIIVIFTSPSHPFPNFFLSLTHLVQIISFSLQPSAVIKIKDGGHNFHYENTVHSLPEIMPVLWAKSGWVIVLFLGQNTLFSQYLTQSRSKDGYSYIARKTCDEVLGGNLAMDLHFLHGVVIMLLFASCCVNWDGLHCMGHLAQLHT